MLTDKKQPISAVTAIRNHLKADTQLIASTLNTEDVFTGLYESSGGGYLIIQPKYNPATLFDLTTQNNILLQCIEAMTVNIDGSGYEIRLTPEGVENKAEQENLKTFFNNVFPGKSFISMRRDLRQDLESTGNAYLEVIRDLEGNIIFLRNLSSVYMRLLQLDAPINVDVTATVAGKERRVSIPIRERRYVQSVGAKLTYFKEVGSKRDIDKTTGDWGENIPVDRLGSEVIHFTLMRDAKSAYGLPRWINQLPSVLGSRKAEEFNLGFFDAGGVPPVLVFVQGGSIAEDVRTQLELYLSGKVADKFRGYVVEVQSTSGSLDSEGRVDVKIEKFGDTNMKDAMFQTYDKNCEEHVRSSFRLPSLFIGRNQDLTYASAYASYLIAEAQVFSPERVEFDSIINTKICKELGAVNYEFRSLPIAISDIEQKLAAIGLVKELLDKKELVTTVNDMVGLNLVVTDEPITPPQESTSPNLSAEVLTPKSDMSEVLTEVNDLLELGNAWLITNGVQEGYSRLSKEEVDEKVASLGKAETQLLNQIIESKTLISARVSGMSLPSTCCQHE